MSAGVRPERPALGDLIGDGGARPSLESLIAGNDPPRAHSKLTPVQLIGRANRSVATARDEEDAEESSGGVRALGTLAALGRDIPGVEAAQAGVRSLVRRQPYRDALTEIRGAEDDAPSYTRIPARVVGGASTAGVLPANPVAGGFLYGAARGALNADPDVGVQQRGKDAAVGGAVGAVLGRATGLLSRVGRSAKAPAAAADAVRTAPKRLLGVEEPRRLLPTPAANLSRDEAGKRLAKLLQKNVDEGAEEMEIAANPPSNPDLMRRIEATLLKTKAAKAAKAARLTPATIQ